MRVRARLCTCVCVSESAYQGFSQPLECEEFFKHPDNSLDLLRGLSERDAESQGLSGSQDQGHPSDSEAEGRRKCRRLHRRLYRRQEAVQTKMQRLYRGYTGGLDCSKRNFYISIYLHAAHMCVAICTKA